MCINLEVFIRILLNAADIFKRLYIAVVFLVKDRGMSARLLISCCCPEPDARHIILFDRMCLSAILELIIDVQHEIGFSSCHGNSQIE